MVGRTWIRRGEIRWYTFGHGHVDLFAMATFDRVGGGLAYQHGLTRNLSAFAQGWLTKDRDHAGWRTNAGVLSGLRWRW